MKSFILALTLLAYAGGAQAQSHTTCMNTAPGLDAQCMDSSGRMFSVHTDMFGSTVRDNQGHVAHIQKDILGGVTVRGEDGSVVQGRPDGLGGTAYRGQDGRETRCRPSPLALPGQTATDCE